MLTTEAAINFFNNVPIPRISLKQAEAAQLMNRLDSKYVVPAGKITAIFEQCIDNYQLVEISDQVVMEYYSEYFDTPDQGMYLAHHNQRANRYKIRIRTYRVSDDQFLEIKLKTANGKTKKKRITYNKIEGVTDEIRSFISSNSTYSYENLVHNISTEFKRVTLVSKNFDERITIDLDLKFISASNQSVKIDEISIVELKREKGNNINQVGYTLKKFGMRPGGFSKYSIGNALLNPALKRNRFKRIILQINKIIYDS